ncbi:hypothetical protein CPT_Privateer_113 [Proteus phage Privateer]|uniref:Uncharacterized protein n=1 Tax=Proteus phage Privateer TaxID=2712958 RepID=A0A6G8R3Z2_9CAUD|nr:hypothetical protein HWD17_gp142 [Proteus phage Privateer]QIN94904.1 hypothetical protein CPT_Privateer_113 [Proteus phage Privateer]
MKKGTWIILSMVLTITICTFFVKLRYDIGFRGEQLYLVYPIGGIIWGFLAFVLIVISGGTILSDECEEKGNLNEKR